MSQQTLSPLKRSIVGVQFMFVAFGSTVLVPLLVGFDPAIALLAAGLGTLLFHAVTGGKVPIYLGSSFAFIAPIIKATELYGLSGMFCGLVAVGLVYILMSFLVKLFGVKFIKKLFPPIVIGPVIILIGLSLAGTGVDMASKNWILALVSLFVAIICSCWGKGMIKLIPVVFRRTRRLHRGRDILQKLNGFLGSRERSLVPASAFLEDEPLLAGDRVYGSCGHRSDHRARW